MSRPLLRIQRFTRLTCGPCCPVYTLQHNLCASQQLFVQPRSIRTYSTNNTDAPPANAPFPFLWPSLPQPPAESPHKWPAIITANPSSWTDRLFIRFLSVLIKYSWLNRSMNWGLINMLLTQRELSVNFIKGSAFAFGEFLARLSGSKSEPWQALCTEEFVGYLEARLPTDLAGSKMSLAADDSTPANLKLSMRDCWLWLGKKDAFVLADGKFGGIKDSESLRDPKSRTVCVQLPYTALVQEPLSDGTSVPPLDYAGESGIRFAVDIQMDGDFKYTYGGEEMTESRQTVVRFISQHFPPQVCKTDQERSARIFKIREELEWKICDVDYVLQRESFADHRSSPSS